MSLKWMMQHPVRFLEGCCIKFVVKGLSYLVHLSIGAVSNQLNQLKDPSRVLPDKKQIYSIKLSHKTVINDLNWFSSLYQLSAFSSYFLLLISSSGFQFNQCGQF